MSAKRPVFATGQGAPLARGKLQRGPREARGLGPGLEGRAPVPDPREPVPPWEARKGGLSLGEGLSGGDPPTGAPLPQCGCLGQADAASPSPAEVAAGSPLSTGAARRTAPAARAAPSSRAAEGPRGPEPTNNRDSQLALREQIPGKAAGLGVQGEHVCE